MMQTNDENKSWKKWLVKHLLPNTGTLFILLLFMWVQNTGAAPWLTPIAAPGSATTINYQGRLFNSNGSPVNSSVNLTFSLYNQASSGSRLWGPESHNNVPISDGLFSVLLGSQVAIPSSAIGGDLWLEISVNGETLSPREQLGAVPVAMTVPDSSITNAKLNLNGDLLLGGDGSSAASLKGNYTNLIIRNTGGLLRAVSGSQILFFLDSDNNETSSRFFIGSNNHSLNPPLSEVFTVWENGNIDARGTLDMHGHAIINQGAMIEANLQTPSELAAKRINRFTEGDVLCWGHDQLELCTQTNDSLIQAVADENGKPIVIGAEKIKVAGLVRRGDLLVASTIPGYAMVNNHPTPGTVIAQALEDFAGEQGVIKAMIRKF